MKAENERTAGPGKPAATLPAWLWPSGVRMCGPTRPPRRLFAFCKFPPCPSRLTAPSFLIYLRLGRPSMPEGCQRAGGLGFICTCSPAQALSRLFNSLDSVSKGAALSALADSADSSPARSRSAKPRARDRRAGAATPARQHMERDMVRPCMHAKDSSQLKVTFSSCASLCK